MLRFARKIDKSILSEISLDRTGVRDRRILNDYQIWIADDSLLMIGPRAVINRWTCVCHSKRSKPWWDRDQGPNASLWLLDLDVGDSFAIDRAVYKSIDIKGIVKQVKSIYVIFLQNALDTYLYDHSSYKNGEEDFNERKTSKWKDTVKRNQVSSIHSVISSHQVEILLAINGIAGNSNMSQTIIVEMPASIGNTRMGREMNKIFLNQISPGS